LECLFYIIFYQQVMGKKILPGRTAYYIMFAYTAFGLVNMLSIQGLYQFNTYTLLLYSLIVVFLTTSYFISLLRDNKLIVLSADPLTWMSIGAFIFFLCSIPYCIFFNYTLTNITLAWSLNIILIILNCFMYSSYTIAFLCRKHFQQ
jgi:hypothetical protein